jgi:endoglucanase
VCDADLDVDEIYHVWFSDGSDWDNALTSPFGPAPGYLPGGPNASYGGDAVPPGGQPPQKSYLDWNGVAWSDTYRDQSWEITEPGIYYQSAHVRLVSSFVAR